MAQSNAFGKEMRKKLIDIDHSTAWLCEEVTKRTGLYCDTSYISKIVRGERTAKNVVDAIREILEIKEVT